MKLTNTFLVSILVAFKALQLASASEPTANIVGGTNVPSQDVIAKSTVALIIGPALCSGSVIADDLIVTAAHCLADQPSSVKIIFANQVTPETMKKAVEASRYAVNPDYRSDKTTPDQNDIALVEFKGGLPKGFAHADLLSDPRLLKRGETVVLAGFGISDAETKKGAGTLRETTVQIADENFGKTEILVAENHGHGACHGDSGGPAFVKSDANLLLWGVTSRSYPNSAPDDCAHEAIYTKIMDQMDFIHHAIPKLRK